MTTPSTTVLVDSTPDERSTSQAMSVNGEGNPFTRSTMGRRQFELLAAPIAQDDHRHPSSVSFDASLDQLATRNQLQRPPPQHPIHLAQLPAPHPAHHSASAPPQTHSPLAQASARSPTAVELGSQTQG
ncbi:MAG: hypothetical protein Q9185_005804 [Variospora sp. 1 TL-2023]